MALLLEFIPNPGISGSPLGWVAESHAPHGQTTVSIEGETHTLAFQ